MPRPTVQIGDVAYSGCQVYSAESSGKTPQTACKYREQAVYEVVVNGGFYCVLAILEKGEQLFSDSREQVGLAHIC